MLNIGKYSIRKKLTWMNLLVSGLTLLIASSAFVAYELATLKLTMVRDLSIQAQIAGANCASAVEFDDPESARNTLSALDAAPNITSVAICHAGGRAVCGVGPRAGRGCGNQSSAGIRQDRDASIYQHFARTGSPHRVPGHSDRHGRYPFRPERDL